MKQKHVDYQVVPNSKLRRWFAAAFRSAQHTPMMHGLIEVDVTRAREFLREHKAKTGEALSFTAFLMACLFDHDIIDGAPAARFIERLKELIESGYGLDDSIIASKQAITPETSRKS